MIELVIKSLLSKKILVPKAVQMNSTELWKDWYVNLT